MGGGNGVKKSLKDRWIRWMDFMLPCAASETSKANDESE